MANTRARWYAFWFGSVSTPALSALRIGFALVCLYAALTHLPLAELFYSDHGVAPRAALWAEVNLPIPWLVLWALSGDAWLASALCLVWAGAALCLLSGWHTRWAACVNWICVNALYWRNPFVTSGADDILRVLSFWLLFVPLAHHAALDAIASPAVPRTQGRATPQATTAAFPVRLVQIQLALIYGASGLFKLVGWQWRDGTALFYTLQLHSLLRPFGEWLAATSPLWVLNLLTYAVLLGELTFPLLVFLPVKQPTLRWLAIGALAAMHAGIAATMTMPLMDFLLVLGASYAVFGAQAARAPHVNTASPAVSGIASPAEAHPAVPGVSGISGTPTLSAAPAPAGATHRLVHGLRATRTVALAVLLFCVLWETADEFRAYNLPLVPPLPPALTYLLTATGLQQDWGLFAPIPYQTDWRVYAVGMAADGTTYDARTLRPMQWEIMPLADELPYRWKRFEQFIALEHPDAFFNAWSRYSCKQAHAPSTPPVRVQIWLVARPSHAPGQAVRPQTTDLLWMQGCE